ncbi:osteocalcin 2-like [Telopea speciosissima]|uniref:osteocalcin 2-like n=1 Tax=Telopea speciosissima TaxID=54955 RepID=UPI001CC39CAC|nr:osteocalcin 2-like [Telopea speciosissima]
MSSTEISSSSSKSMLSRCMKAPSKLLSSAKSFYDQTMNEDVEDIGIVEDLIASPHGYFSSFMPRSSSSSSSLSSSSSSRSSSSDSSCDDYLFQINSKAATMGRASSESELMRRRKEDRVKQLLRQQSSKKISNLPPKSSNNKLVKKVEIEIQNLRLQRQQQVAMKGRKLKSQSERIGTIHEEEEELCELGADGRDVKESSGVFLYPRSKTCSTATECPGGPSFPLFEKYMI